MPSWTWSAPVVPNPRPNEGGCRRASTAGSGPSPSSWWNTPGPPNIRPNARGDGRCSPRPATRWPIASRGCSRRESGGPGSSSASRRSPTRGRSGSCWTRPAPRSLAGAGTRFVLVQHGGGGSAFARSLHLEEPGIATCVVDVPPDHPEVVSWVVAEAARGVGIHRGPLRCGRPAEGARPPAAPDRGDAGRADPRARRRPAGHRGRQGDRRRIRAGVGSVVGVPARPDRPVAADARRRADGEPRSVRGRGDHIPLPGGRCHRRGRGR